MIKNDKFLKFPKTKDQLNIGKLGFYEGKLKQVRVVPMYGHYVVEMIFNVPSEQEMKEPKNRLMSIDLGNDNLATIVTNTGRRPVLVKGKNIKSINQRYNQLKAHYMGVLRQGKNQKEELFSSKRLEKIHQKRFNQIKDLFHKASFRVMQMALVEDIDTSVIGQNKDWKQNINNGKKNNGENDSKKSFSGRRITRGMYRSKNKALINADVNGSANIMRKAFEKTISCVQTLLKPTSLVLQ